jgi:PAS domain S-box-containing protein
VRLRQRMLLIFAVTLVIGTAIVYVVSREMVLASFRQLEDEQMKQNVRFATAVLDLDFRNLAESTDDYAYWDRMCEFMVTPGRADIRTEFEDKEMEQLGFNLVVIRDMRGKIVFARAYDRQKHQRAEVPAEFLREIFLRQQLQPAAVALKPQDGILEFADGPYIVSTRPILTSQRSGNSRGVFMLARKFDAAEIDRLANLTRTTVTLEQIDSPSLPGDFLQAREALRGNEDVAVQALSEKTVAGYITLADIFHRPLLLLRVATPRPIYERGKLSQLYLFGTALGGAVIFSLAIIFFMQKFILSRIGGLSSEVHSIGKRNAVDERVNVSGQDELTSLGNSINEMLGELQKSQKQVLLIAENIDQAFWIRDAKSGRYDYASSAFEKIRGCSRELRSAHPQSGLELLHPEDRALAAHAMAEQFAGNPTDVQYRIVTPSGGVRWLWERTFPLRDESDLLKQIAGLTEDTTDFKHTEEALRHAQSDLEERVAQRTAELAERGELVRLLLDSTPGAMYGIDFEANCTFCNPAALRLLGYDDAEEILGKKIHGLIHHTRADGSICPQEECPVFCSMRTGQDAHLIEESFWRKNGESFPGEYSSRRLRRNGEVVGAVVTFVDTTDRRRQEIEVRHGQKLEAVGRLAAGIAHEINTPIQFVGDNTRFLVNSFPQELKLMEKYEELLQAAADGSLSAPLVEEVMATRRDADWPYLKEEIPRALEQMLEGLGRVSTIVRGMKEFSHVDRSNEKSAGDINRAIESTLIVVGNELKHVADVETELGELPAVPCQLGDLNQVFLNLLINAAHAIGDVVKGTEARGVIRIVTRAAGDWVEIAITDSGTGIPEEVRDKMFDPFFTTKEVGKGTGQGLALARAVVVDNHGGTLTFVSEMGKGTTFLVRLPLRTAEVEETLLAR